ncbi:MAG TPA: adenylyltransferase/cytidyltransferase family protein [Candidatus Paceibacterota bacterium]
MTQTTKKLKKARKIVVAVSGGFDPVHIGHVRMFNKAKSMGDELVVIVNNDNWLKSKKGYVFMPQHERKEIIEAFEAVDRVIFTSHPENPNDMSVCEELKIVRPHIFANGGDRTDKNVPEISVCDEIGCEMIYNVGYGGKVQSSSWLVGKVSRVKSEKSKKTKNVLK